MVEVKKTIIRDLQDDQTRDQKLHQKNLTATRYSRVDMKKLKLYILLEQIRIEASLNSLQEVSKIQQNKSTTFFSLFLVYFMMYFCLGILPPNITNIMNSLPLATSFGFGIVIALNLLVGMFTMIILGYFGEIIYTKISRKVFFFIMNMIWITCYGLISLVSNFNQILILIATGALGIGSFLPLGFSMVSDLFPPEQRGAKFGMMHIALVLGNGCGMLLGSLFGNLSFGAGWRLAYCSASIIAVVPLLGFFLFGTIPRRKSDEYSFYTYRLEIKEAFAILKKKSIAGILGTVLGSWIAMSTLATWSIFFLSSDLGNNSLATLTFLIAGLGALPGAIIGGRLGDKQYKMGKGHSRIKISFLGTIHGTICFMLFYFFSSLFFFGTLGYFLTAFSIGNQFALYSELVSSKFRSTINALNGIMMNTGGIIGNLLLSSLIRENIAFLQGALLFVLIIWAVSSLLWIFPYLFYKKDIINYSKVTTQLKYS
jgi:MFS family permease